MQHRLAAAALLLAITPAQAGVVMLPCPPLGAPETTGSIIARIAPVVAFKQHARRPIKTGRHAHHHVAGHGARSAIARKMCPFWIKDEDGGPEGHAGVGGGVEAETPAFSSGDDAPGSAGGFGADGGGGGADAGAPGFTTIYDVGSPIPISPPILIPPVIITPPSQPVVPVIPETSTWLMLLIGAASMLGIRKITKSLPTHNLRLTTA